MNFWRLLLAGAAVWGVTLNFADQAHATTNSVAQPERRPLREPAYQGTPKYSLLTLGNAGNVKVWLVEDGRRLFVDQNANGDLTDDGPPLEPSQFRDLGEHRWDFNYLLDAIKPADGSRHTHFVLRHWNYNDKEDSYGLSLSVDDHMPLYAGWFGTFWSTNAAQAPVIHFGGPFTPKLLRRKEFTLGETGQRLSLALENPGSGPGAESRLSIEAPPTAVVPELKIAWPVAAGSAPLQITYPLTERCCYWEFYTTKFAMPPEAVTGTAKISVVLPATGLSIELTTSELEAPVVAATPEPKAAK